MRLTVDDDIKLLVKEAKELSRAIDGDRATTSEVLRGALRLWIDEMADQFPEAAWDDESSDTTP